MFAYDTIEMRDICKNQHIYENHSDFVTKIIFNKKV